MNWSGSECVTAYEISVYHSGVARSSGMWRCVPVLDCLTVPQDDTRFLRNVGNHQPSDTVSHSIPPGIRVFDNVHLYCTGALDWSKLHGGLLLSCLHPSIIFSVSFKSFLILSSLFLRQYNEFDYIYSLQMYSFEHWGAICVNAWKLRVSMATSLERRSRLI